ncbi:hypothetical protein LCGC14_1230380 [marine sediment metagenome]|uniref:Uncharacterized protein n=1 Tax=marine sediment metagenome TaxID=412755 RepID=A0A0F9PD10_9ZZZZ
MAILSEKNSIQIQKEIFEKLDKLSKILNVSKEELIELAFNELFELVLSDPSIFLEKVGIIDNIKKIISEK